MDKNVKRVVLLSTLGYTAFIIASCPCESMGYCKKEQFLVLASIPLAFALYNFVGGASCSAESV
jgi:hypothetical protein